MLIYADGCSFTYGDELSDPKLSSWPNILGNITGAEVFNNGYSGSSNQRIVYQTLKNLQNNYDFYIIAWTDYSRFTFYKSDTNNETNFNTQLIHAELSNETFFNKWGLDLYRYWYNDLFAFKLWLQQIIQLQHILKYKKYIMINTFDNCLDAWLSSESNFITSVKHLINFDIMNDQQILAEHQEIQYYNTLIDHSKFYKWDDFYIRQLCNDFEVGEKGHILEEGHKHLATLLEPYV